MSRDHTIALQPEQQEQNSISKKKRKNSDLNEREKGKGVARNHVGIDNWAKLQSEAGIRRVWRETKSRTWADQPYGHGLDREAAVC